MRLARIGLALLTFLIGTGAMAAAPQLFRQPAYESAVRGAPDDLLLLAGYGFADGDMVVFRAVTDTTKAPKAPEAIPATSDANLGCALVVSYQGVPYSLTIRLPKVMLDDQSYALWVRNRWGEWSSPVMINDARPLWASPAYGFASDMPAFLPRELKIVGRNLQPSDGHSTLIRLSGPQSYSAATLVAGDPKDALYQYVATLPLPDRLTPGKYHISVNRDGASWVELPDQVLEILPDPLPLAKFRVDDPRFGGCKSDDGKDDTACVLRAIGAATTAGGGTVYFGPGTWDLVDGAQPGLIVREGIVVSEHVQLMGAGSALTRLEVHAAWNARVPTPVFTLVGHTLVTGFTFSDPNVHRPDDKVGPFLQLGEDWQRSKAIAVSDVLITKNSFDKPAIAIGGGGLPIARLFLTYNTFGAYHSALELSGDQYNMAEKYRMDESVIDYNIFKAGSELDLARKTGTIASELGAGYRFDFSNNTADGASTDYLYDPNDASGWRAGFFWAMNNNIEEVLISQNTLTCTGDKIGDGEAIALDNNANTFAFAGAADVVRATASSIAVSTALAARQHDRNVPVATYYVDHWIQVVSGPGHGQARRIVAYSTDMATQVTTIRVAPAWDVIPVPRDSRVSIGRENWQVSVVDNTIDNRRPLCKKSNRSRRVGGAIGLWAQSVDTVIAGNRQYDSDGIFVHQLYAAAEHVCADCSMMGFFNFFLDIRDNLIDGEYEWANDCSRSGIGLGIAAADWGEGAPPTVSFGVSVSHNRIRHADEQYGGAIAVLNTWLSGPDPHRWPLSDNLLIYHNAIADIDGPRSMPLCGSSRPRIGLAFPDSEIAWRTVLYANSCKNVSMPLGPGGVDSVKVCPSPVPDSCECPKSAH